MEYRVGFHPPQPYITPTHIPTHTTIPLCIPHYRVGFADKANQDVVNTLVTEVKAHLPDVLSVTIKGKLLSLAYTI